MFNPTLVRATFERERENTRRHHLGRDGSTHEDQKCLWNRRMFVLDERVCRVLLMLRSLGLRTKYGI
jgi:hypothetical protein